MHATVRAIGTQVGGLWQELPCAIERGVNEFDSAPIPICYLYTACATSRRGNVKKSHIMRLKSNVPDQIIKETIRKATKMDMKESWFQHNAN